MRVRGDGFLLLREGAPGTVGGRDGGTPGCPRTDRIWVDGEPRREKAFLAGGTVGAEAGGAENGQSGRQPAGALETAETEPQAGARYHPVLEAFQQGTWGSEKTSLGQRDGKQAGGSLRLGRSNRPEQTGDRKGQGACWLAQQSCGQMGRMAEDAQAEAANGDSVEGGTEHCERGRGKQAERKQQNAEGVVVGAEGVPRA